MLQMTNIETRFDAISTLAVREITVLCHFCKNDLMPIIICLTFRSLFYVISIPFYPKPCLGPTF